MTTVVSIRLNKEEMAVAQVAATAAGLPLATWVKMNYLRGLAAGETNDRITRVEKIILEFERLELARAYLKGNKSPDEAERLAAAGIQKVMSRLFPDGD